MEVTDSKFCSFGGERRSVVSAKCKQGLYYFKKKKTLK